MILTFPPLVKQLAVLIDSFFVVIFRNRNRVYCVRATVNLNSQIISLNHFRWRIAENPTSIIIVDVPLGHNLEESLQSKVVSISR